jgi:GNAT superfamily N-acetyltransferase
LKRINRPYFEDQTQEVLRASDLRNISAHYSRDPGSGFWLFEHADQIIGLIAVDASNKPDDKSFASESKGKSATIRHFYVDEPYRAAKIQEDLLEHAVKHAFSDPKVQRIEAFDSPLVPYLRACLRNAGFQFDHNTKTVGILRWSLSIRYLNRDEWKGE